MKHADLIIPFSQQNDNAVDMLIQNLKIKMRLIEQHKADIARGQGLRNRSVSEVLTPLLADRQQSRSESSGAGSASNDAATGLVFPSEKV